MAKSRKIKGLRFECTQCGECCTRRGKYAHVYVSDDEVTALADYFQLSRRSFMRRYTFVDVYGWRQIIFDKRACPFLDERLGRCRVYSVRPVQCRTFPFWKEMFGPRGWTAEARSLCEGLNRGRHYRWAEIELYLREMEDWETQ